MDTVLLITTKNKTSVLEDSGHVAQCKKTTHLTVKSISVQDFLFSQVND